MTTEKTLTAAEVEAAEMLKRPEILSAVITSNDEIVTVEEENGVVTVSTFSYGFADYNAKVEYWNCISEFFLPKESADTFFSTFK